MNQITPYEQLLAQEMEHLPLPGNMESIWVDIENQLDLDLPPGGGKNPPRRKPAPSRGTRWTSNWRLYVIAGVIAIAILLFKNNRRNNDVNRQRSVTPQEKTIITDSTVHKEEPLLNNKSTKPPIKKPAIKDSISVVPPDTSLLITPPLFEPPPDKQVNSPVINPGKAVVPPAKDSVKSGRKRRGVPDINDSDYRLVPQRKDSTRHGR